MPNTMTIYAARCREKKNNTFYPNRHVITCAEDLRQTAAFDHVCAEYGGNKRSIRNFIRSDCLPMDLDNDHSERQEDWKTLDDIRAAFPGVPFYAVPSRNHMKPKDGKSPRPRWHVYFPIEETTSAAEYRELKERAIARFPWFDDGARDAARQLFGVEAPEVTTVQGDEGMTLTAFLEALTAAGNDLGQDGTAGGTIPEGQRNSTLHLRAVQLLTRYGDADGRARTVYDEYVAKCEPPLDDDEVETIWKSALAFFSNEVKKSPDYLPPDAYAAQEFAPELIPEDFSDVGQAGVMSKLYAGRVSYSAATDWMFYDGTRWVENSARARGLVHQLTRRQLRKARDMKLQAVDQLMRAQESGNAADAKQATLDQTQAERFHKFVLQERRSARISAALTEAAPYLQVEVRQLDADPFLLNTPTGTVDLRTGKLCPHRPEDYCTKLTGCAPGSEGAEIFAEFLDRVTCGDAQLREYLQHIAGMFAVGAVYREGLIIAYGAGGNGKSTLFNLLAYVFGDYAGNLSAETLTVGCRQNKSPEYAELRGKRLVIAAELEDGQRFNTAVIKKLCSTDPIFAEKKFKAPFTFIPSHTLVLYTNHLPRVGASDRGAWDRLVVVPFRARFRGQEGEVLNYAQYLYEHAGGAVLQWIIGGARKYIEARFRIDLPDCVQAAIGEYREENDWMQHFLDAYCDIGPAFRQPGGTLYAYYRQWCAQTGEYTRHPGDFSRALQGKGFNVRKGSRENSYSGLRLKPSVLGYAVEFSPAENYPE